MNKKPDTSTIVIKDTKEVLKKNPDEEIKLVDYVDKLPPIKSILESFPEELRNDLTLTGSQVLQLMRFTADRTFGMAQTVPINCQASNCDFSEICLYNKIGIATETCTCPKEGEVITRMVPQLIKDLEVDSENYLELNMVQEYVDAIIQEHRSQKYLAISNDIVPRTIAIDQTTGLPIYQDDSAPSLLNKEKAQRKKERLRKELVATREGRLKYKITNPEDESTKAADMRKRMEETLARNKEIEDAEYEVKDNNNNAEDNTTDSQ